MRRLHLLFTAFGSLGSLSIILVLGVLIITLSAGSYLMVYQPIGAVYRSILRLNHLKDEVEYSILDQALYTGYYSDFFDEDYLTWALGAGDDLAEALATYQSEDDFDFSLEQLSTVTRIEELQAEQAALLTAITGAVQEEDDEAVELLRQSYEFGTVDLMEQVSTLILTERMELRARMQQVQERVTLAVTVGVGSLVVLPLLAMATFGMAASMARPILALSTAITALGGEQFRPELLEETIRRKDRWGELARAIEGLAADTATQERALHEEVEELRKELHAARRRKIVFSTSKPR